MNNHSHIFEGLVSALYITPYEKVDWPLIKNTVSSLLNVPEYYNHLSNIYLASIHNNILYLYNNQMYVGCPGNFAKGLIGYLGMPDFMDRTIVNNFIFQNLYEYKFCMCGYQFCDFNSTMIIPHPLFYSI